MFRTLVTKVFREVVSTTGRIRTGAFSYTWRPSEKPSVSNKERPRRRSHSFDVTSLLFSLIPRFHEETRRGEYALHLYPETSLVLSSGEIDDANLFSIQYRNYRNMTAFCLKSSNEI